LILLSVIIVMLLLLAMAWWFLQTSAPESPQGSVQRNAEPPPFSEPVGVTKTKQITVIVKPVIKTKTEPSVSTPVAVEPIPEIKSVVKSVAKPVVKPVSKNPETVLVKPLPVKPKAKPALKAKPKTQISKVVVLSLEQQDEKAANLATKMLQSGETEKASTFLYQFLDQHRVDTQSRAVLVSYLISSNQMAEADYLLSSADLRQSSHLRRLRAHWYAAKNQPDEAIAVLNSRVPEIEADVEYHVLLAALYQQQGYGAEAVARYAELIRYNPDMPDWWVGMAIGLDRSEQYSSATKAYQRALEMDGLRTELAEFAKQRLDALVE
jgi:MSHA biogenesis protein MshN